MHGNGASRFYKILFITKQYFYEVKSRMNSPGNIISFNAFER